MKLFQFKKEAAEVLDRMDQRLAAVEKERRNLTHAESLAHTADAREYASLSERITELEGKNSIRKLMTNGQIITERPASEGRHNGVIRSFSSEYAEQFMEYIQSNGQKIGAVLDEGTSTAGGFAVPSVVDGQIVPLAPNEMSIRQLATVIPTSMDIKIPQKGSFGATTAKAENATFTENDPTLSQITLSAFMAGNMEKISWELAQDVPAFQSFCVDDGILAQQMYEENLYVNGTGTGEAQGLLGNVGAGVTAEVADGSGNLLSIDATFDVMGTLKAAYFPGASWLMSRASSIELRKAQKQANLFEPVFTRVGTQDFLHGFPVYYSASMPAIAAGATPVLFGNFKMGYVVGDRGGSGINVKVLDQPFAVNGQIALLFYRRTDGRVRRSEAIQGITLHT